MNQYEVRAGHVRRGNRAVPGAGRREVVFDTRDVLPHATTAALLADWDAALPVLAATADAPAGEGRPVSALRVLPPVTPPGQIYGAGANYREHVIQMAVRTSWARPGGAEDELAAEAAARSTSARPTASPTCGPASRRRSAAPTTTSSCPPVGSDHDWELELGVVIGRRTGTSPSPMPSTHVAGYTICNDLTTRSLVPRTDIPMMGTDWMRAKNFPTFYPTGPWLVPAGSCADPLDLGIRLRLNGDDDAGQQHRRHGLRPGAADLLHLAVHGAEAGRHGHHWLPARQRLALGPLPRPGDVLECEIDGLGVQRTRCVPATR